MTKKRKQKCKWHLTTWKGSRRQQHREFLALPFSRKLEIIEEMSALAAQLRNTLKAESPAALRGDSNPYKPASKQK
jgi:hypothetical protein